MSEPTSGNQTSGNQTSGNQTSGNQTSGNQTSENSVGQIRDNSADPISFSIVVPAAGCGTRTGLASNKILAPLHRRPLLYWTIRAFLQPGALPANCHIAEIVIASRREEWDEISAALDDLPLEIVRQQTNETGVAERSIPVVKTLCQLVEGGKDRQSSVANAARIARGSFLLVHDAARPLLSAALIERVCLAALHNGAAIAALPCSDTIKRAAAPLDGPPPDGEPPTVEDEQATPFIESTVDRNGLWLAQTPQIFERSLLLEAQKYAAQTGFIGTDCASLLEHQPGVQRVALVEGDPLNFKVTYAADIERAELLLPLIVGHSEPFDARFEK